MNIDCSKLYMTNSEDGVFVEFTRILCRNEIRVIVMQDFIVCFLHAKAMVCSLVALFFYYYLKM